MGIQIKIFDATHRADAQINSIQLVSNGDIFGIYGVYNLEKGQNNIIPIPSGEGNATAVAVAVKKASSPSVKSTHKGVSSTDTGIEVFYSKISIPLVNNEQYILHFVDDELVLEPAFSANVTIPAQLPQPGQTLSIVLLNKTRQLWGQFTMLQLNASIDSAFPKRSTQDMKVSLLRPATPFSSDVLYLQPFVSRRAGAVGVTSQSQQIDVVHDWNTDKQAIINAFVGQPLRLIGIFPPDDRKHPLRSVINVSPFIPTTSGTQYEVHLNKRKTQLKIKAVSHQNCDSDSDSD